MLKDSCSGVQPTCKQTTRTPVFQFHGAPDFYEAMLKNLNIVFTTLFSLECILKIIAFGPLVSNHGRANLQIHLVNFR